MSVHEKDVKRWGKAAKFYHLTPKGKRYCLLMRLIDVACETVFMMSDEAVKAELKRLEATEE